MIALIQRVTRAEVTVAGESVGAIDAGVLAFVAAEAADDDARARRLAERVLNYRIFADEAGRMNVSARAAGLALLAVPQFTLAADTRHGNRPGFSTACAPERAHALFDAFVGHAETLHAPVATGRFGADMQVSLINDGPVTFWLHS